MIWEVIFVVLMILWLFGGGAYAFRSSPDARPYAFGSYLLPWICVAILGALYFGAIGGVGQPVIINR